MTDEPKKISFGFSKVSKKNTILQPIKRKEEKNDIQFIECLEEKSIKLVNGQEEIKELPIIPMRNGNLLRDSIREVIKSREENKSVDGNNLNSEELTLDELAAKEILEDLKKNENKDDEKSAELAVNINSQISVTNQEQSSLEDYESMPISDFGLAMLRGMGWDPKKGIGLNGQIVSPLAPPVRPKGMGLGADKTPAAKSIVSNGEVLIMKKGAAVKIINGPYNNLYGRIEGFDELPGRLMVRITANNIVVSLNEIMVQLVSNNEFNKNVENNQMKIKEDSEKDQNTVKSEKKRLNNVEAIELISSVDSQESKQKEKYNRENTNKYSLDNRDEDEKNVSSSEDRNKKYKNHHRRNREENRHRSRSPKYQKHYSDRKPYSKESKYNRHKESRKPSRRHSSSSSSSSVDAKVDKKFTRRTRNASNSSDSDTDRRKQSYKSKHHSGHSSSKSRSYTKEDKYSSKFKNYHRR